VSGFKLFSALAAAAAAAVPSVAGALAAGGLPAVGGKSFSRVNHQATRGNRGRNMGAGPATGRKLARRVCGFRKGGAA